MIVGVNLMLMHAQEPSSLGDVPMTMITTVEQLQELSRLLVTVSEFAIDLEVSSVLHKMHMIDFKLGRQEERYVASCAS